MHPFYPIVNINLDPASTTCFADYSTELFESAGSEKERHSLRLRLGHRIGVLLELLYKEGYRTFLCPLGGEFGCVAASAVLHMKEHCPDVELVPVQANVQSRADKSLPDASIKRACGSRFGKRLSVLQAGDREQSHPVGDVSSDGYSIENALMIGLSSTVVIYLPEASTPGQIPASLALAKQLDLRIINLSPDRDAQQYENRVEPFIRAALSCPVPTYGVEYLCGRWILEHEYGMEGGDREWRHLHTYSNFECEWNLEDDGSAGIYYNGRSVCTDTFLYDELTGALSFSSKGYTVKDLTGNHLELLDCSSDKGIRLLLLRKIHWNRPPASIRQKGGFRPYRSVAACGNIHPG